jgi:hypothetical protein
MALDKLTDHELLVLIAEQLEEQTRYFRVIARQIACHNFAGLPLVVQKVEQHLAALAMRD